MLKKKHSSKQSLTQHNNKQKKCSLCHPIAENKEPFSIADQFLRKKYSRLITTNTAGSSFNQFQKLIFSNYSGGSVQFNKLYLANLRCVRMYHTIDITKLEITSLIKQKCKNKFRPSIHFHGQIYQILVRQHANKQKNMKIKQKNPNRLDVFNYSFINSGKTASSLNRQKRKTVRNMNESYQEMKILCKNIGAMCNKLEKQKSGFKFKQRLKYFNQCKSKEHQQQKQFKQKLGENFSIIRSKNSKSKHKIVRRINTANKEVEQIYGISNKKNKMGHERLETQTRRTYSNKRASTEKAEIVDSPISKAYYSKQYNYTETAGPIKSKRSKQKKFITNSKSLKRIDQTKSRTKICSGDKTKSRKKRDKGP